ncbi:hypothetical protein [Hornefia butyriciproducens]|uniref:hypothetical protein n=1 Tax=Hornefia butyriciproducens TaxID=2652293 RepID=UPI0023F152EE|nr:hypothetical protein [Hornefia butyriciproducens]MCI7326834.1 hypothetical protein [Clostridiales bacterium]MCI7412320.1 hypothetical protein [Clostridiales bacterium]MCI7680506.1 hypothetical protein [Clostridiales bacterium]MDD6298631.1 hypothetical protein [Hornefia butyriciproducens]MDY2990039.1 hypothetical protein [Hornefia butyriciproducens]
MKGIQDREWPLWLKGEFKVPYIGELRDDAPDWVKEEYWEDRREIERKIRENIPIMK